MPGQCRTGVVLAVLLTLHGAASPAHAQLTPADLNRAIEAERRQQRFDESERRRTLEDQQGLFTNTAWIEESAEKLRDLVILPPLPPVLGETEPDPAAPVYPAVLIEHAGETFFMVQGRMHFRRLLTPAQTRSITAYRETRDQLVGELRLALAAAEKTPVTDFTPALAELAIRQEPALRSLEAHAEKIRADLAGLDDGAAVLNLREKVAAGQPAALRDYFSAIHAAHFEDGLSLDQRQLLLGIAFAALRGAPHGEDSADVFLPAPARLHWPADPAGELTPLLAEFRALRERLETELWEQVVQPPPAASRAKAHAALAAQQAPQFAELHRLAEGIRIRAAGLDISVRPAPSDFPPELVRTVGEAVTGKNAFQARTKRLLSQFGREFAPLRFKLVFRDQLPVIETEPAADQSVPPAAATRLHETNRALRQDYQALAASLEHARLALQRHRETLGAAAPEAGKLSAQLARTYAREENGRRFADYRTAVLTPGLSPAQRRLLFNAALRDLEKHRLQAAD